MCNYSKESSAVSHAAKCFVIGFSIFFVGARDGKGFHFSRMHVNVLGRNNKSQPAIRKRREGKTKQEYHLKGELNGENQAHTHTHTSHE